MRHTLVRCTLMTHAYEIHDDKVQAYETLTDAQTRLYRGEQCHNLRLQAVVLISELRAWARPSGPSKLY